MKHLTKRIVVCLFALILGGSLFIGVAGKVYAASARTNNTYIDGRTDEEVDDYIKLIDYFSKLEKYHENEQLKKDWERYNKPTKTAEYRTKKLEDVKTYLPLIQSAAKSLVDVIENGENADHIENAYNLIEATCKLVAVCFGPVADIAVNGVFEVVDALASIGESSESELTQLKNHLDDKFDEMDFHLDEIQRDISELSKQVDSQTAEILNALSDALEANTAKQELSKFMTSRDGNFDYSLFKEYLYASADPGSSDYSPNAYFNKLQKAIIENASDRVIKDCYDNLYKFLNASDNRTEKTPTIKLFDYLMKNEYGTESIQYYYYEYLNANRDSLDGEIPAFEALLFTLDLYQTALFADYCIEYCNTYQLLNMKEYDGELRYYFGSGDTDYVTYDDIVTTESKINKREDELLAQILSDMTVFYGIGDSYILESADGSFRSCVNNTQGTFGNVRNNETVYLSRYIPDWCEAFGLDPNRFEYAFSYQGEPISSKDGIYTVSLNDGVSFVGTVSYDGILLYSVPFTVGNNTSFSGGTGTETDPYIISTSEQFQLIYSLDDGYKKHYELSGSIDLGGKTLPPLFDEMYKFVGSFNGNGYTIYNFKVVADDCCGLFGYVGQNGQVSNLTITDASFRIDSTTTDKLYVGAFAGKNEGTLYNCHVTDRVSDSIGGPCTVTVDRNTASPNYTLYTYAGGLVGENSGTVLYCSVDSSAVTGKSALDYQTNSDGQNQQFVYVGGLFGSSRGGRVANCYVGEDVVVEANVTSTCTDNLSSRHPIIKAYSGGAGGFVTGGAEIVQVYSDIESENTKCKTSVQNDGWLATADKNRVKTYKDELIASFTDEENEAIQASNKETCLLADSVAIDLTFEYNCLKDTVHKTKYADQIYSYGDKSFNTENLWLFANGEYVDYQVLAYYGFNTSLSTFTEQNGKRVYEDTESSVTVLVYIDQYNVIKTVTIPIIVKKVAPVGLAVSVMPNKTKYDLSEAGDPISLEGALVELVYADGYREGVTSSVTAGTFAVDNSVLTEIVNVEFDDAGVVKSSKKQSVGITYVFGNAVFTARFEIEIICVHTWRHETISNHCTHLGYTIHTCDKCGAQYKDNYSSKRLPHETVIYPWNSPEAGIIAGYRGYKDSTCQEKGYTGDVYCTLCGRIVEKGVVIDYKNHEFDENHCDGLSHVCIKCGEHSEQHFFKTIEGDLTVENECIYCHYRTTCSANSRSAIENLPRITISNAYALPESDQVVMFVELHGNVGITGAYFSVKFPNGMTLVSYSLGNILNKPDVEQFQAYGDHLNVQLAHRDAEYSKNGTLLKLVFSLPESSNVGDEFVVEIAGQKLVDANANPVEYLTFSGVVSVVERLPGDVNGDGLVDILDATLIAKYNVTDDSGKAAFVNDIKDVYPEFDISYGDVTLDTLKDGEDIVRIIRYFVGGYDVQLWANRFKVILNFNNPDLEDAIITVDYNNGNGMYGDRLIEAEIDGYRFDGWYTDRSYTRKVEGSTRVGINPNQLKQTLYAHYTLNVVSFNGNGCQTESNGEKQTVNYSDYNRYSVIGNYVRIDNDCYFKVSTVTFNHGGVGSRTDTLTKTHTFLGWATSPDGRVDSVVASKARLNDAGYIESIDLKDGGYDGLGSITLYAVWSVESVADYLADTYTGYSFALWKDLDSIRDWNGIDVYEITESKTFEAQWNAIVYTIIYVGNGGTVGGNSETEYEDGVQRSAKVSTRLSPNSFVRDGYTFKGWSLTENGQIVYKNVENGIGYIETENNRVVRLYAIWEANPYQINYYSNYSNSILLKTQQCYYDSAVSLADAPTRTGYSFCGWYKDANCSKKVGDAKQVVSEPLAQEGEISLYAKWVAKTYIVTLDRQNGSNIKDTLTVTYDNPLPSITPPIWNGYTFGGYFTAENGDGTQYYLAKGDGTMRWNGTESITLYAKWTMNTCSVTFDTQSGANGSGTATVHQYHYDYIGAKPLAPSRSGYIFVGYYDQSGVGNGTLYIDDNMNVVKGMTTSSMTLYAHWVKSSTKTDLRTSGSEAVTKNNVADRLVTEDNSGVWVNSFEGKHIANPNYTAAEKAELKRVGYNYLKVDVDIDIRESQQCWVWVAVRYTDNKAFAGDINIYKLGLDSILKHYGKPWDAWTPNDQYKIPNLHLVTQSIGWGWFDTDGHDIGLLYGATGKNDNQWYLGSTSVSFIPTKENSSAKIVAKGFNCSEDWFAYTDDYAAIK